MLPASSSPRLSPARRRLQRHRARRSRRRGRNLLQRMFHIFNVAISPNRPCRSKRDRKPGLCSKFSPNNEYVAMVMCQRRCGGLPRWSSDARRDPPPSLSVPVSMWQPGGRAECASTDLACEKVNVSKPMILWCPSRERITAPIYAPNGGTSNIVTGNRKRRFGTMMWCHIVSSFTAGL